MIYLLAILLPWLSLIVIGKVFQGLICLVLQLTLIGWLPATIWALLSISNHHADQRTDRLIAAVKAQKEAGMQVSVPFAYSPIMTAIAVAVVAFVVYLGVSALQN